MTAEVMPQVERRYSRKVGDSFRRDREHLALFEELSMHEDLDSSLAAMDTNLPSAFEAAAQRNNVLELEAPKTDDDWLVTIPEVPPSPKPAAHQNVVTNDNLSSIRTSRSISRVVEPAPKRNASPSSKSPRPGPSPTPSKSPRPAFTTSTKSPRPTTTASYNARSSSSPRSTSTKSSSPRLFTPPVIRSSSPSTTTRSSSARRATIATAAKAVKSSSPTYNNTRASTVSSSPGRRASTGSLGKGPLLGVTTGETTPSTSTTGSTKTFRSRSASRASASPYVSSTDTRGTSPARSGFITRGGTSPSRGTNITSSRRSSSPARSVSSITTNRKPSPTRRNSSPSTPESHSSVTSGSRAKGSTAGSDPKPHNFAYDFPAETPANLRTSSFKRGSGSPGSLISRSYDDPSNSRRQSASSADFDSYLSKSQDRGSTAYLSGSRPGSRDPSPNNNLGREPMSSGKASDVGGLGFQPFLNRRASTGDHRIPSRNVTVSEYGLDGRRASKGSKEIPQSPKVGQNLGRPTTLQQDPAFESSLMRRSSDPTASRSVGYNASGGGFKPFMTNNSIPSFNTSMSLILHRKLHQMNAQPPDSVSPPASKDDMAPAGTEESSKVVDQRNNTVKRTQMGFALKKEDVVKSPDIEARTELDSKSPRLTSLVVSKGPVKIYQGLGDIEDMGANWCCGMEHQYRGFCKEHECGIYKNFHDALVVPNSKPDSRKQAGDGNKDSENVDSPTAGMGSDNARKVNMESADSVVKSKCRQESQQEEMVDSKSDPSGAPGRRKRSKEGGVVQEKGPQTLSNSDPSEIIMMSPVSVCESETSEDGLSPLDALSAQQIQHLRSVNTEAAIKKDFNWELDTLESPSRPLKSPDFFQVSKRHGEVAISRVQSFNASEYEGAETDMADTGATEVHPSKSDSDVAPPSSKITVEVAASSPAPVGPRLELERAMDKGSPIENTSCRAPDDSSNVRPPEETHITPQRPAKLFPFVKSPKDGGYYKRDVSMSRISSTSATSIDLTRSVDTTCSAHSQYDNALWDDPNYSGRFGDPLAGIPYKSIATLPLPLPVEVRCMESPGAVLTAPNSETKTPGYSNDGLEKLAGYMRSASLNARKRRIVPSSEENCPNSSGNSFDYFVDFLDSQPDLELDDGGLTDALVSAHKEAKKLESSPGGNNNLRFIKRLDSRLSNNSLISDKSYESRVTEISSDSSWESGKNRGGQPMDAACQVMEQIVENANAALSHGRHLSSFKFGQKKTAAISADLEESSPPESDYGPSQQHSKHLSSATSDSSQKSAKHYDERLADESVLPALKSTPGIVIMPDKPSDDGKFGLNSLPRESTNDELDGNLWEAVQIMEEEQEMEAELTPPAPVEFAIRDFTPARTPARTPVRTPARTPSHAGSKASSHDSRSSGVTRSPSVGSKASSKHLDSDMDGAEHMDFTSRQTHRSYCGCNIL